MNLTTEKRHIAKVINKEIEKSILNPAVLTGDMLRQIIKNCEKLIESDF